MLMKRRRRIITFGYKLHKRGVLQFPDRRVNPTFMFYYMRLFCSSTTSNYIHPCKKQLGTHINGCVLCIRSRSFTVKCAPVCLTKSLQYRQKFGRCALQVCQKAFSGCTWPCMLQKEGKKDVTFCNI